MSVGYGGVVRASLSYAAWSAHVVRAGPRSTTVAAACLYLSILGMGLVFCANIASALDGTWDGPGDDWNTGANWSSTPTVPDGIATFSGNAPTTIFNSATVNIDEMFFTALAPAYTFDIQNTFNINGTGIVNASSNIPIFDVGTVGKSLNFRNASTAGNALFFINGTSVEFFDTSTAGNADFQVNFQLFFHGASTAGNATFDVGGRLDFLDTSSAGNATFNNDNAVSFLGTSSAGNATIISTDRLFFSGNSTGGNAKLTTSAGAETDFSASRGPANDNRLTMGSIAGAGAFYLGPNRLTVGRNDLSTEIAGVISDCGPTGTECQAFNAQPSTGGSLVKTGTGTLTLSGANIYTGPTVVNQGKLVVNGSIGSDVTVNHGSELGGSGAVGGLTVNEGTVAPGNSIGTMTVNGTFTLGSGAVYRVEANAGGQSDKVVVKGAVNLTGATLRVLAPNGNYKPRTDYVIIDNDGGDPVNGSFASVGTTLAFLTPAVIYNGGDGNDVVLTLLTSAFSFCDVAKTPNQCNVAEALDQFPTTNALYLAVLNQTAAGARQAFDALSGEIHATVAGTLADDSRYVREAVLGRLMQAGVAGSGNSQVAALAAAGPQVASLDQQAMAIGSPLAGGGKSLSAPAREPLAFWTRAYGAWGDFNGDGNAATADRDLGGFVSDMDANIGGSWRAGLATGASFSNVDVDARYSSAEVDSYHLGGYLGGMEGAFALRGGGMWAWSNIDTSRAVVFPGFFERQTANYNADTGQLFGEVAYPTEVAGLGVEPFAGLAYVSVDTGTFRERGGRLASLRGVDSDQDVGYSTLGLRAASTMHWGATLVTPHLSAAWQHGFDDVTPGAALAFASTGIGFGIAGVPLAEDSALIDAGLDFALGERTTAGVSYTGQFGDGVQDNGVKGRFTWLF